MQIIIKSIQLTNFKGQRDLFIEFDPKQTNIFGRNRAGKTTVVDAFLWSMFGKDSTDRTTFEIKTLDENNKAYHRLDHEVTVTLLVDGDEVVLKRSFREKWTKKKGSPVAEFTGHETSYEWNGVPCNEKEYSAKISSLIPEGQFKLLTNLAYFNTVLKWEDRRSYLLQLAGGISDLDFATELNTEGQYDHLIKALGLKKSLEEYRKELVAKKKAIKDDAEGIPYRISEANNALPEEEDYSALEAEIEQLKSELQNIDEILQSKSAAEKKRQERLVELERKRGDINRQIITRENDLRNSVREKAQSRKDQIDEARRSLDSLKMEKSSLLQSWERTNESLKRNKANHEALEKERDKLVEEWSKVNAETFEFDPSNGCCPTCKQDLPEGQVEEKRKMLEDNFNTDKAKRLDKITHQGFSYKHEIEESLKSATVLEAQLSNIKAKGDDVTAKISSAEENFNTLVEASQREAENEAAELSEIISGDDVIAEFKKALSDIDAEISQPFEESDNSEVVERKRVANERLQTCLTALSKKDDRKKILARIEELKKSEQEYAQALADVEALEFSLIEFDRAKMELLEKKINGKFQMVTFKLFEEQINGGQKPACVTLIDGVPYPDANTASKVNASLDIINVFSEHFGVKVPVFIDNRESVTDIIPTDLQIINLIVSPEHKKLTVKAAEAVAETV